MIYNYKCQQDECEKCDDIIQVRKPMMESSREEKCEECGHEMNRQYSSPGIKTFGDGYKS